MKGAGTPPPQDAVKFTHNPLTSTPITDAGAVASAAPRAPLRRAPRVSGGRIVGGLVAAVLVVGAALIAGFFIGRDSVNTTPAADSDAALTAAAANKLVAASGLSSELTVTPEMLTGDAANKDEEDAAKQHAAATAAVFQAALGTPSLSVSSPVVTSTPHPVTGAPQVVVSGTSTIHGVSARVHTRVRYHLGQPLVAAEFHPSTADYSIHALAGVDAGSVHLPALQNGKTAFVVANYAGVHQFVEVGAPRASANVQPGLNVVSSMSLAANPGLHTLLATTAPASTPATGRRLAARSSPLPAGTVSPLPADEDQWFHEMEADVEGLLRPAINMTSRMIPSIVFNHNLAMNNVTVVSPADPRAGSTFNFTANATLSLAGCQPVTLLVSGSISNTTYRFAGKLGRMQFGPSSAGVFATDLVVTASGGRGPAIPDASVTYKTTVTGKLGLSGVKAQFSVDLPMSDSGSVNVDVQDVHLGSNVVITGFKLALSDDSIMASGKVSITTHLGDAEPLEIDAAVTFDDGVYFVAGSLDNWMLPIGPDGVNLQSLSLMMSGPASVSSSASPDADADYTLSVSAAATIGDISFDASLNLPAVGLDDGLTQPVSTLLPGNVTNGVTFELTVSNSKEMTVQKSLDATLGSGATSLTGSAASVLSSLKDVSIESVTVGISTSPLSFLVRGKLNVFKLDSLDLQFVAQRVKCKWEFGVGVALESAFKFSNVVPSETAFDYLPFATGMVIMSTSNATFTMPTGATFSSLTVSEGVALTAELPFKQLSERLVSDGEWDHVEYATVTGSWSASTDDLKFSASLPANLPLTKDLTLTTGDIMLASTEPHFTLDAAATLKYSSVNPALDCSLTGSLGDTSYALTASIGNWHIGAESKGVTVTSASLTLDGTKDGSTGNWSSTGSVKGDVSFGSVVLDAIIDLPVTRDHLDIQVPLLKLNKDVTLSNIDMTVSDSGGVKTYSLAGKANITFAATDNLVFDATATITGSDVSVTGSIPTWNIGGANGVKCTNVDFSLSGTYTSGQLMDLTGKLSGDVNFFGVDVTFEVALPMSSAGVLKLTVAHLNFGQDVELNDLTLTVQEAEPKYAVTATATIGTGLGHNSASADDLTLTVNGYLEPKIGNFSVAGTMANWAISNDFSIASLEVNVTGARKSGGTGTDLSGWLKGSMHFDSVTVDVEAALPADSLTVSFPTLKLTNDVELKDVSMTITGSTPSFTFTGSAVVTTHLPTPLTMTVSGSISGSDFTLDGTMSSWTLEVGHTDFTVTSLTVHIEDTVGGTGFSGSMSGTLDFDSTMLDMTAALPGSAEGGLELTLTLKSGDSMTLSKAISATCGSSSLNDTPAPSSTKSVTDKTVADAEMKIVTKPPTYTLSGKVDAFGNTGLGVNFVATEPTTGSWKYAFAVTVAHSFKFSDVDSSNSDFDHLPMVGGGVAIANYDDHTFTLAGDLGTITATDGVAFMAAIPMEHLHEHLAATSKWGTSGDAKVNGTFGLTSHDLALEGSLPPNLPLGSHVLLNASVTLEQQEPHYKLDASAAITMHKSLDPVYAAVDVDIDGSGAWTLTGTADQYTFHIGSKKLSAASGQTRVILSDGGGTEFKGSVAGMVAFRHPDVNLGFNISVPAESPDAVSGGFSFELFLEHGQSTTYGQVLSNVLDGSPVSLPHSFSDVFSARLLGASIWITTEPQMSLRASGSMSLFHMDRPLTVTLGIQSDSSGWSYGVGVDLGAEFDLSQVLAKASSAGKFKFVDGGLVITNSQSGFTVTPDRGTPITMKDGIAIQGTMALSQGHLSTIQKWSNVDSLTMLASFGFDTKGFRLEADLDADWHIGKSVAVTKAFLFMDVGGSTGFDVGVGCDLAATIGSGKHQQTLDFTSDISIGVQGLSFEAAMTDAWKDPFGLKGVTVEKTEIMLSISFAGVPDAFGFSGGLVIGSESGSATVYVNPAGASKVVLGGRLSYFSLGDLLEKLTDNLIPSFLTKTIFDVSFTDLSLEFNSGPDALVFDDKTFPVGFRFSVKRFDMFGITGSVSMIISPRTFYLNATVDPIQVGHNGDILSLSGYECTSCPAVMDIGLGSGYMPGHVHISGQASLLSLIKLDASVNISDAGIGVYIMYTDGIFEVQFALSAPGLKKPSDFSLYAAVEQKLLDYIGTTVVGYLKKAKESADSKLDEAKDKVKEWDEKKKPEMDANSKKIDELKKEEEDKFTDAENKLKDEEGKLNSAKNKVNGLQNEINKYDGEKKHCKHWYDVSCKTHNGWLDTKIAALWVAKHAADAALDVANDALKVAKDAVSDASKVVANIKPEVVKLEAENAAIEVAYKAAEAGLDAAKGLTNAALDAIDFAAEAVANILNIEEVSISAGSLAGVKKGAKLSVSIKGIVVGEHFDWTLSIDFPPKLDDIVSGTWDKVKSHMHI